MAPAPMLYEFAAVVVAGACCIAAGEAAKRVRLPRITGYLVSDSSRNFEMPLSLIDCWSGFAAHRLNACGR